MHDPQPGIPFEKFLGHFAQEIIIADAEIQLLQRQGWIELNQGFPLAEGLDHLEYLGLTEVKLNFRLVQIRPGIWSRIKRAVSFLLGRHEPAPTKIYRIGLRGGKKEAGIDVTVIVCRDRHGRMKTISEPANEDLKGIYVTDLFS